MKNLIIYLILIYACFLNGQAIYLTDSEFNNFTLNNVIHYSAIHDLNTENIYNQLKNKPNLNELQIHTDQECWNVALIKYSLIKNNTKNVNNPSNNSLQENVLTFKLINKDFPSQYGSLTCSAHYLSISIPSTQGRIIIEPLTNLGISSHFSNYVLYNDKNLIEQKIFCRQENVSTQEVDIKNSSSLRQTKCVTIDIALACDKTIFDKYGGLGGAEAFMVGVLNNVQTNYDNDFPTSIEFSISGIFVPENFSSDPWNGINNIDAHLEVFKNWANAGGFGAAAYAVATAWTSKYVGTYGLAYTGGVCGNERYNVCSDFGAGASVLRCLQSHEMGHNFNCNHDSGGSPYIMAPGISASNVWSSSSISSIENYLPSVGCKGICSAMREPIADFDASAIEVCPNIPVQFMDLSFADPTSWLWTFSGGLPSVSQQKNPIVYYSKEGQYDVTLKVSNSYGSHELKRVKFISVKNIPVPEFSYYTIGQKLFTKNLSQNHQASHWKFGDGGESFEDDPEHLFSKDGIYNLELCVVNTCTTQCKSVMIEIRSPLKIDFDISSKIFCVPSDLTLINKSNGDRFVWQLVGPDTITSTLANPKIRITKSGRYSFTLKAFKGNDSLLLTKNNYLIALSQVQCPKRKKSPAEPTNIED